MGRVHKGKSVSRFIATRSTITSVSWNTTLVDIDAPFPYYFTVTTDAKSDRFWTKVRELPSNGISAVIRYDAYIDNVGDAIVGMRLEDFVSLLAAYNATITTISEEEEKAHASARQRGVRRRSRP